MGFLEEEAIPAQGWLSLHTCKGFPWISCSKIERKEWKSWAGGVGEKPFSVITPVEFYMFTFVPVPKFCPLQLNACSSSPPSFNDVGDDLGALLHSPLLSSWNPLCGMTEPWHGSTSPSLHHPAQWWCLGPWWSVQTPQPCQQGDKMHCLKCRRFDDVRKGRAVIDVYFYHLQSLQRWENRTNKQAARKRSLWSKNKIKLGKISNFSVCIFAFSSALEQRQIMKYLWNEKKYLKCDINAVSMGQ